MERLVHTFYHYLAKIGSLYKTYGSRERIGSPLGYTVSFFLVINGWRIIGLHGGGGTVIIVRNFGSFKIESDIHFCVGVFSWHF